MRPVHEVKDHSVDMLRQQIAESRELLGSRLRLYQIHSATLESGVLDDRDVLNELARLRAGGLAIGLSVSGPEQGAVIRRALEVTVDGVHLFQTVQATWNLLEPSAGPALADAKQRGCGVIVKEGRRQRATDRRRRRGRRPRRGCEGRPARTVDALALAAVLAQPWADVVLSGAVTASQLLANVRAAGGRRRLHRLAHARRAAGRILEPPQGPVLGMSGSLSTSCNTAELVTMLRSLNQFICLFGSFKDTCNHTEARTMSITRFQAILLVVTLAGFVALSEMRPTGQAPAGNGGEGAAPARGGRGAAAAAPLANGTNPAEIEANLKKVQHGPQLPHKHVANWPTAAEGLQHG